MKSILASIVLVILLFACDEQISHEAELVELDTGDSDTITLNLVFEEVIRPKCQGCHGGSGGFSFTKETFMDETINVRTNQRPNESYIVPNDPDASYFYRKMTQTDVVGQIMPTTGKLLNSEIELVRKWIDQGAIEGTLR